MADGVGSNQLFEQWRKQFEEGAQAWSRLITQTAPASPSPTQDPTAFWRPVLDQGVQTWAKLFAKLMGQSLDQMLVTAAPAKKVVDQQIEQALQALNLPSRSQLTGIAKQLVELEDCIDRLEDSMNAKLRRLAEREPK